MSAFYAQSETYTLVKYGRKKNFYSAFLFHQLMLSNIAPHFTEKIKLKIGIHNINIRRKGTLSISSYKHNFLRRYLIYNTAHLYNFLPSHLKRNSVRVFKYNYENFVL